MASSSLARSWLYHVFLSFRGEDVRKGFLSHVMKELKRKGIIPFVDNEIKRGESVGPVLVGAIRQSRVAVVLLSRNYASSSWCLDELVEIMKCREEYQQTVMTIFYEVEPTDVRKQTGDFGKAFDETCVGKTEEVKQAWQQALKDVAGIAGYHSSNCDNEAEMINKVASDVMAVLGFTPSRDFEHFVGIRPQIMEIKYLLSIQSEEVKVIGILGPAGIGKTTTARVLYNQLSPQFSFSTFLENIRGSYEKPCGNDYQLKLRFQKDLLSQLLNQKEIEVRHLRVAQEHLSDKKVLAVFDEVDSWWQLEEMANQRGWFGPGSILIITTEDRKLFKQLKLGVDHIYEMKFPTSAKALQIFCQYAFGHKSPDYGFERLAREVTWLAGNLPLGLRVMGSYLRGMSRDEWIDALPRLRSSLDREIESTLRFSYDSLTEKDKTIFLHIACFFDWSKVDEVKSHLENSGLNVNHGLQVLADKSLISIEKGYIRMHSLLEKMGREIVKKQCLEEPGNRQFLWDSEAVLNVFEGDTGTGNVLGIKMDRSAVRRIQISKSAFDGMNNLQFLQLNTYQMLCVHEGLNCFPHKLSLLIWRGCSLTFWPSKFSGEFLVELILQDSRFEKLWEGIQPLQCLKLMDLRDSQHLKETPDLSKATNLEKLDLWGCLSLLELTSSIGNATKLKICILYNCRLLKGLPSSIGRLVNLEELDLRGCLSLKEFSGCASLKELNLINTAIEELPSSMSVWSCLYKLDITGCTHIKDFPNVHDSIVELDLCRTGIEEVPPWIENLFRLKKLIMNGCEKLKKISPNISKLESLEFLTLCNRNYREKFRVGITWGPDLNRHRILESTFKVDYILSICLHENVLSSTRSLDFIGFGLKSIPDCITSFSGLSQLVFIECKDLVALPPLPGSLQSIKAEDCRSLERIDSSSFLNPNICLNFAGCYNLNQKSRKLIRTSASKYALLPGEEVPAYFPHRASSCALTINLTPTPLPSSLRFKACILLSYINSDFRSTDISCCVRGTQSDGRPIEYTSIKHRLPFRDKNVQYADHLYIFEDSFCLNQDFPEAEEATFSKLSFEFIVHRALWKVKGCGVRLLEIPPHCILDRNDEEEDDDDDDGDEDESANHDGKDENADDGDKDESADDDGKDENANDGDKDESADDGEGSLRRMFCFNYRKKKGKSGTKRVLKGSLWSRVFAVKRNSSSINQTQCLDE